MAFLSQDPELLDNLTIEETIFASDNPVLKIIQQYEKALENSEDTDAYQKAYVKWRRFDAWDFETRYKQILFRLKLEGSSTKSSIIIRRAKKEIGAGYHSY